MDDATNPLCTVVVRVVIHDVGIVQLEVEERRVLALEERSGLRVLSSVGRRVGVSGDRGSRMERKERMERGRHH